MYHGESTLRYVECMLCVCVCLSYKYYKHCAESVQTPSDLVKKRPPPADSHCSTCFICNSAITVAGTHVSEVRIGVGKGAL